MIHMHLQFLALISPKLLISNDLILVFLTILTIMSYIHSLDNYKFTHILKSYINNTKNVSDVRRHRNSQILKYQVNFQTVKL